MDLQNLWYRVSHQVFRLYWRTLKPTTLGVKIMCFDSTGRILLVKPRYLDTWVLPGGGVHKNETPESAAVRELLEETGIKISLGDIRLLGLISNLSEGKSDYVVVYATETSLSGLETPHSEIEDVAFFSPANTPVNTSQATRRRLSEYRDQRPMQGHW